MKKKIVIELEQDELGSGWKCKMYGQVNNKKTDPIGTPKNRTYGNVETAIDWTASPENIKIIEQWMEQIQ